MKLFSIASGSSGNSICIGDENTSILIDAGISKKRIVEGLEFNNIDPLSVKGIMVTHEHLDHISGLGVFTRKYKTPIYATRATINNIKNTKSVGVIDESLFNEINPDESFNINGFEILPFCISHDAANPVAYRVSKDNSSVAVATDMGYYDDYIINNLKGLDAILIEANYDVNMLHAGSYPYQLKQRILSNVGHLSNEMSGRLLNEILHDNIKHIFLGHLSKENNYAALAYESVRLEITLGDNKYKADDFDIKVLSRETPSKAVEF